MQKRKPVKKKPLFSPLEQWVALGLLFLAIVVVVLVQTNETSSSGVVTLPTVMVTVPDSTSVESTVTPEDLGATTTLPDTTETPTDATESPATTALPE